MSRALPGNTSSSFSSSSFSLQQPHPCQRDSAVLLPSRQRRRQHGAVTSHQTTTRPSYPPTMRAIREPAGGSPVHLTADIGRWQSLAGCCDMARCCAGNNERPACNWLPPMSSSALSSQPGEGGAPARPFRGCIFHAHQPLTPQEPRQQGIIFDAPWWRQEPGATVRSADCRSASHQDHDHCALSTGALCRFGKVCEPRKDMPRAFCMPCVQPMLHQASSNLQGEHP